MADNSDGKFFFVHVYYEGDYFVLSPGNAFMSGYVPRFRLLWRSPNQYFAVKVLTITFIIRHDKIKTACKLILNRTAIQGGSRNIISKCCFSANLDNTPAYLSVCYLALCKRILSQSVSVYRSFILFSRI